MLTFLYLNSVDGNPYITTCPFNKLIKGAKGILVIVVLSGGQLVVFKINITMRI